MEKTVSLTDRADTFSDCIKAMEELLEKRDECRKRKTVCVCVCLEETVRSSQSKTLDLGRGRFKLM